MPNGQDTHDLAPGFHLMKRTSFLFATLMITTALVHPDDSQVINDLAAKATKGDVRAQAELAGRYRDGKGVAKDETLAIARRLPVEVIAEAAGTIGYEPVCSITRRVRFVEA